MEDEKKIADAVKKGLEQESYAVDVTYNGKRGLSYALSGDYDLIILDRMLPDITDGLDICEKLREQGIQTPVLILTAKDQIQDRVTGLNSGADDYLVKPFNFNELLARVRALLRRPRVNLGTILIVGDLELDTVTYAVRRSGKNINLTAKEYALLEYLMRSAGRVVSKDVLINQVWNEDGDVLLNTVEVYIGYLRNKIDKPFSAVPLIHTIRGFGYKIEQR